MTIAEAINIIEILKAQIEWEEPLDYQIALDMAINALKGNEMLAKEMTNDGNITTGGN